MKTRSFFTRRGATAVEYGLLAALISVAVLTSLRTLGWRLEGPFEYVQYALNWDPSFPVGIADAYDTWGGGDGMDPTETLDYWNSLCPACQQEELVDTFFEAFDGDDNDLLVDEEYDELVDWFSDRTNGGAYGLMELYPQYP
jgi:pilus assembly protein Flp/PilA